MGRAAHRPAGNSRDSPPLPFACTPASVRRSSSQGQQGLPTPPHFAAVGSGMHSDSLTVPSGARHSTSVGAASVKVIGEKQSTLSRHCCHPHKCAARLHNRLQLQDANQH